MIGPNGKPFTSESIGTAIAIQAIMADLRAGGDVVDGPAPSPRRTGGGICRLGEALVQLSPQQTRP